MGTKYEVDAAKLKFLGVENLCTHRLIEELAILCHNLIYFHILFYKDKSYINPISGYFPRSTPILSPP